MLSLCCDLIKKYLGQIFIFVESVRPYHLDGLSTQLYHSGLLQEDRELIPAMSKRILSLLLPFPPLRD